MFEKQSTLLQLWRYECNSVFADRFALQSEKEWFSKAIRRTVAASFGGSATSALSVEMMFSVNFPDCVVSDGAGNTASPQAKDAAASVMTESQISTQLSAMTTSGNSSRTLLLPVRQHHVYGPVNDMDALRSAIQVHIDGYNRQNAHDQMKPVLFDDTVANVLRVTRVLGVPRGHAVLVSCLCAVCVWRLLTITRAQVGEQGRGRATLARLAATVCGHYTKVLKLSRPLNKARVLEFWREMFRLAGVGGKEVTVVVSEDELVTVGDESYVLNQVRATLARSMAHSELVNVPPDCSSSVRRWHSVPVLCGRDEESAAAVDARLLAQRGGRWRGLRCRAGHARGGGEPHAGRLRQPGRDAHECHDAHRHQPRPLRLRWQGAHLARCALLLLHVVCAGMRAAVV